jgi:hypothetical protein
MHPCGPVSFLWGWVWRGKGGLGGRVTGFVKFFIFYCCGLVHGCMANTFVVLSFFYFLFFSLKVIFLIKRHL